MEHDRFENLFRSFEANGFELRFVGGCVRDHLLGIEPKDFDFATDARPDATKHVLTHGNFKWWPIGEKFGTIAAKMGDEDIEITTYRKDMTAGRHPDVSFTTELRTDLERRDFTINSMAMTKSGRLIDPFGGAKDLTDKLIRCTGTAWSRFREDPLRMLHAARFAARFSFRIDDDTVRAASQSAHSLLTVSRERWLDEMTKLLVAGDPSHGIEYLRHMRLLWLVVPELWASWVSPKVLDGPEKNLWYHTLKVLYQSPPRPVVRWAALLHDIAKPQTYSRDGRQVHFLQHEVLGAEMVEGICRRLKMSNEMRRAVRALVFLHQRVQAVFRRESGDDVQSRRDPNKKGRIVASDRALRRLVRECDERGCQIEDLLDLFGADCSSRQQRVRDSVAEQRRVGFEALERMREEDMRPKLPPGIGNAIMDHFNLKPGPEVGKMRDRLEEMLLDGEIKSDASEGEMLQLLEEFGNYIKLCPKCQGSGWDGDRSSGIPCDCPAGDRFLGKK